LTALLGFVTTALYLRSTGHRAPVDLPLVLLACAPIALRRRWPVPALALATAAIAALTALGRSSFAPPIEVPHAVGAPFPAGSLLPLGAMLGLAGYMVAARLPRRSSVLVLIAAEAALGVALGVASARGVLEGDEVQGVLFLAAAWFVGDSVSARRAAVTERVEQEKITEAGRARLAIREERVRIARELHDVVAHSLAVITVQAGVGWRLMATHPEQASTALESIEAAGRAAQNELRVVLGLLRDDDTDQAQLAPAPGLEDLEDLAETVRAAGTPVELVISGTDRRLSPVLELSVYRIVQEALTNVVKHAPGAHATVDVTVSAQGVSIEVADDGQATAGEPPVATPEQPEHGIIGMHERVGAFGGSLVAEEVPGHGFRVRARIPAQDEP
jgi:signal transduction histidine kinase